MAKLDALAKARQLLDEFRKRDGFRQTIGTAIRTTPVFGVIPQAYKTRQELQAFGQRFPNASGQILRAEPLVQKSSQFLQRPYNYTGLSQRASQIKPPVARFVGQTGAAIAEDVINLPSNLVGGTTRTGLNLGRGLRGDKVTGRQILEGGAPLANAFLTALLPGAGKTIVKGGIQQAGRLTFKQALVKGGIEGGLYGGGYGLVEGIQSGENIKNNQKYVENLVTNALFGTVAGGAFGGALGGAGNVTGRIQSIAKAYKQVYPNATNKQLIRDIGGFLRDELGRFAKQARGKNVKEPIWYGDARVAAGLPRYGEYDLPVGMQASEIKQETKEQLQKSVLDKIQTGFRSGREAREQTVSKGPGLRTQLIDKLTPVFDLTKKAGKELSAEKNPYKRMRLLAGLGGKIEATLEQGLAPVLKKEANRLDDLSSLLILERTRELQGRGLKTMLSVKELNQGLAQLRIKYGNEGFSSLIQSAQQVRQYGNNLLKSLRDSGIIDHKSYKNISSKNEFYVPFEIVEHIADNIEKGKFGKASYNVSSQDVIQTIKGSEKALGDPLEALVRKTAKITGLVEKNKALKSLVDLRDIDPVFKDFIQPIKGDAPKGMDKISLFVDGKNVDFAVSSDVAAAIKNLDAQTSNILVKVLSPQAKLLRAGATGLNIGFIPANVVRDFADAIYGEFSEKGARGALQLIFSYPQAIAAATRKNGLYMQWLKAGGAQSTLTEQVFKKTPQTIKELAGKKSILKRVVSSPKDLIEFANRVGEQSTRIARFSAGVKRGENVLEASFKSRDITVDFAKSGNVLKTLNQVIPFLNANVQGVERMFRVAKNNPVNASIALGTLVGFPSTLLYANNRKYEDYKDIPQHEKDLNWILIARDRTPEEKESGEDIIGITIPKGHMLMPMANISESFLQFLDQNDPRSLSNLLLSTAESMSPVGVPLNKEMAGKTVSTTLPPWFRAGAQSVANYDFFRGRPIVPRSLQDVEGSEQYTERTPAIYKEAGKLTGISPLQLESAVQTTTGGVGRQVGQLASGDIKGGTIGQITRRFVGVASGKEIDKEFDEIAKYSKTAKTESLQRKREAEKIHASLSQLPREEANRRVGELKKVDPLLYEKLKDTVEETKLGLSSQERFIKSLPVQDGSRARYVVDRLNRLESKEDKNELIKEWRRKNIISENVFEQLKKMKKEGKL